MLPHKIYRVAMNLLARAMRALMRAQGVKGTFCVGASATFYEWDGMRFAYNYREFGVGGDIDSGGATESATRQKVFALLRPDAVFLDIGAHEGLFSISVRKRFPGAVVHAFEPMPAHLEQNLALNGITDVVVHRVAVGERAGSIGMTSGRRSSNHVLAGDDGSIPLVALDDLALPPPTLMKLDIEGFELHALKGARNLIQAHRPIIVTEINDCFLRYHPDLSGLYAFMDELGYALHALREGCFVPLEGAPVRPGDLPVSNDSNYWWLPRA